MIIGAQLYTVRSFCTNLHDFGEALMRISDIGYTSVQVSGTCAFTPEELNAMLDRASLTCDLTHTAYDRIINETDAVIAEHSAFHCENIGLGSMPGLFVKDSDTVQCFKDFSEQAKPAAEKIARAGKHFMYHNHDREYLAHIGNKNVMEMLCETFDEKELGFTLDMYWVGRGGYDPVSEIKRLKNRLHCVHLKDMEKDTLHFAPVGSGTQNEEAILAALEDAGTKHAFVEQDNCYGEDPFLCLKKSFEYLHSLGVC